MIAEIVSDVWLPILLVIALIVAKNSMTPESDRDWTDIDNEINTK